MHELGLCDAMLKMIGKILGEEGAGPYKVEKVVLEVGELSGVVPHFMEESWRAVVERTPYEGAALEIRMLPGYADCMECSAHFRPTQCGFVCPECGGEKLKPVSGTDMTIQSVEISEGEG